ncbi:hypothetical protein LLE49_27420 [Alicyclobacillus tolerans]|uniref:hypothetical protein n=1 Tax=Alicyclobacillus tolerans TaxID=90970 RepID=UPI001F40D660|nr:hypothetical protein [Alicyclobacillus tolerans]MCF8568452.1 hypothetical protein [Alicyclobacillus tolerans]
MQFLAWLVQIVLFFVLWRVVHWLVSSPGLKLTLASMVMQIVVNVVAVIVLLIVVDNLHSAWWTMPIIGAVVGLFTGETVSNGRPAG